MEIDFTSLIPYMVEKITKGVKKQLKGYVSRTQNEIEDFCSNVERRINYRVKEFERLIEIGSKMEKDWAAVERMLRTNERNEKLFFDMQQIHNDLSNELMDIKLLHKEISNYIKLNKITQKTPPEQQQ
jgi:hypothetical protein